MIGTQIQLKDNWKGGGDSFGQNWRFSSNMYDKIEANI